MTSETRYLRQLLRAALLCILFAPATAWADASSEKAVAEALFHQAKALLKKGETDKACAKFAASQKLDAAVGTLLFLGDCNEKLGRLASAWSAFQQASELAERKSDKRKKFADLRATALKPRVSKVSLKVSEANTKGDGFALRRDGIDIPEAAWANPLPLDAKTYRFEASAPERKSWSREVTVDDGGATIVVEVPELESTVVADPESQAPGDAAPTAPVAEEGMSGMALADLTVGGVGLASVLVGGVFGGMAMGSNEESLAPANCRTETFCTQAGLDLREQAQSQATISTVTFVLGGVLAAGGATLFVLSREEDSSDGKVSPEAARRDWHLGAAVAPGGAMMSLRRAW